MKMMAVIPRADFIQGQFAFELKKILVHIKQPSRLRKLFLFLRHQENEYLWLFKFTQKGQKSLFIKHLLTQPPRTKRGKLIIIKNSISTGRIILK